MTMSSTRLFDVDDINEVVVGETIKEVYEALEEQGYNPINQLVGYILSGDPGYISSHKEARTKITKIDRTKLIECIVRDYISKL